MIKSILWIYSKQINIEDPCFHFVGS